MLEKSETTQETATRNPEQAHPLMQWKPRIFDTLKEWKEAFNAAETAYEKVGLLQQLTADSKKAHHRLSHDIVHDIDAIAELMIFLMDIADGYKNWKNFLVPGKYEDRYEREHIANDRQYVAQRAFDILCQLYLSENWRKRAGMNVPDWRVVFWNDTVFQKVLWFARRDNDPTCTKKNWLRNVKEPLFISGQSEHSQDLFREFLLAISIVPWNPRPVSCSFWGVKFEDREAALKKFVSASGKFIEILFALERLDMFVGKTLDEIAVTKLTQLAMQPYNVWVYNPGGDGGHWDVDVMPQSVAEASTSPNIQVAFAAILVLAHQARVAKEENALSEWLKNR